MHETEAERLEREKQECVAMLKDFFEQKKQLEEKLRVTNDCIAQFGRGYWKRLGFVGMPRIEALRLEIMGTNSTSNV